MNWLWLIVIALVGTVALSLLMSGGAPLVIVAVGALIFIAWKWSQRRRQPSAG